MTGPDLTRRVERLEEDLTAISDTLLDVKKTVDRHSRILADHSRILDDHSRILADHSRILDDHSRILDEHGQELSAIRQTQAEHGLALTEILRRLPADG